MVIGLFEEYRFQRIVRLKSRKMDVFNGLNMKIKYRLASCDLKTKRVRREHGNRL